MTTQASEPSAAASATADDLTLRIERTFDAPREAVFKAWTDADEMARWWGPEGMTAPSCAVDARPGGKWRTCMVGPDGVERWVGGEYTRVEPPGLIEFTWAWDADGNPGHPGHQTLVTVELAERDGKTVMTFTHRGFENAESRDLHNQGWTSSFGCLDGLYD